MSLPSPRSGMRQSIRKSISDAVEAQIEVMAITDILHAIGFRTGGSVSGDVQRLATALAAAEVEVGRLRQRIWEALGAMGSDLDGDPTPAAVVSDLGAWLVEDATDLRADYDAALLEIPDPR